MIDRISIDGIIQLNKNQFSDEEWEQLIGDLE
jgi:hypothetical protein